MVFHKICYIEIWRRWGTNLFGLRYFMIKAGARQKLLKDLRIIQDFLLQIRAIWTRSTLRRVPGKNKVIWSYMNFVHNEIWKINVSTQIGIFGISSSFCECKLKNDKFNKTKFAVCVCVNFEYVSSF